MTSDPNETTAAALITGEPPHETTFLHETDDVEPAEVADDPAYLALKSALRTIAHDILAPVGTPLDLIPQYADLIAEDIVRDLLKFARGQEKHGGDIRDRDLDFELGQELQDAGIYQRCKRLQRAYVKVTV